MQKNKYSIPGFRSARSHSKMREKWSDVLIVIFSLNDGGEMNHSDKYSGRCLLHRYIILIHMTLTKRFVPWPSVKKTQGEKRGVLIGKMPLTCTFPLRQKRRLNWEDAFSMYLPLGFNQRISIAVLEGRV